MDRQVPGSSPHQRNVQKPSSMAGTRKRLNNNNNNAVFGDRNRGNQFGVLTAHKNVVNSKDEKKYEGSNVFYGNHPEV
jgi:hypothetical protein